MIQAQKDSIVSMIDSFCLCGEMEKPIHIRFLRRELDTLEYFCNGKIYEPREQKAEIRDRINGQFSRHNSDSKNLQTKEKD